MKIFELYNITRLKDNNDISLVYKDSIHHNVILECKRLTIASAQIDRSGYLIYFPDRYPDPTECCENRPTPIGLIDLCKVSDNF